jgi:hypothetical protein
MLSNGYFAEIEGKLRHLLSELRNVFSDSKDRDVTGFIDAGEYRLAPEEICGIIDEENKTISHSQFELIDGIGRAMQMEPFRWERLRPARSYTNTPSNHSKDDFINRRIRQLLPRPVMR